jgi:PAS domain S-box-containing protein
MKNPTPSFLANGGETGALIESIDWSRHPLGPIESWPAALCTTLSIILHSRFPMFIFWGKDLICFYNDAYRPSLGNEGKHPSAMGNYAAEVWPEIWPTIKPQIDQVMRGNGSTWHEDQFLPIFRNGKMEDVYWTYSYSPVIGEAGLVEAVLVICHETTHKVQADQELKNAYKEKNQIMERISDGFFATDRNWIVKYWNPRAEQITGIHKEQIEGRYLWDVFQNAIDTPFYSFYLDALQHNRTGTIEAYFEPLDIWVEETLFPSDSGVSVYIKDITLRKKQESEMSDLTQALSGKAREMEEQNAELQQFVYAVSHDLKEPLRMVNNFLKLLEAKYNSQLDDTARQYIHFATDGSARMRILIDDLLEYSRASRLQPDRSMVDMQDLFAEIIKDNDHLVKEKGAEISFGSLPVISADRTRMRQLLQNLLSNAIKYQPADQQPVINLEALQLNEQWQFCMTDNGIGIAPEYFEKIFMIFQRLHNKSEFAGTGIGLALCKKIVEQHGGRIWVESEKDKGSQFYFTINK